MNHGKALGWVAEAPAVTLFRASRRGHNFKYLRTDEEVWRFLDAAKEQRIYRQPDLFLFSLYSTATFSGLRLGELCALRKHCIDLRNRIVTVEASHDGPPKSGEIRRVPILDVLLPILERHLHGIESGGLVFASLRGTRFNRGSRVFKHYLRDTLKTGRFPARYVTFHSLRHTFASHWVMRGGDLFKLQKILGHASIEMTQMYAHLAPTAFREDHGRFNGLVPSDGDVVRLFRGDR